MTNRQKPAAKNKRSLVDSQGKEITPGTWIMRISRGGSNMNLFEYCADSTPRTVRLLSPVCPDKGYLTWFEGVRRSETYVPLSDADVASPKDVRAHIERLRAAADWYESQLPYSTDAHTPL